MSIREYTINLDLKQNLNLFTNCKQFDNLKIIFTIYDNSIQSDLDNYDVRLKAIKSDKVPLIQEHMGIDINGNIVTIECDEQLTTTAGKVPIELQFKNKTDSKKKATFNLILKVFPTTVNIENTISKATYTLLEELENKLDQASDFFENIGNATEINTTLRETISIGSSTDSTLKQTIQNANTTNSKLENQNSQAITNKNKLDSANEQAVTNKNKLDSANEQAVKNYNALESLGDATDLAKKVEQNTSQLNENTNEITDIKNDISTNYAKKTEVNDLASNKADKTALETTNTNVAKNTTDLAVQTARIDSFTKLADGSTTGDAELIDARIDINGETHINVGDSIRSQISDLDKVVYDKFSIVNFKLGSLYTQTENGYQTGSIKETNTRAINDDFLKLSKNDSVIINSEDYKIIVLFFSEKANIFLNSFEFYYTKDTSFIAQNDCYVKIVIAKNDDSKEITVDDLSTINSGIIKVITNKVLNNNIDSNLLFKTLNSFNEKIELNNYNMWEQGGIHTGGCNNNWNDIDDESHSARIRTNTFISPLANHIIAKDGYEFAIVCLNDDFQPKGVKNKNVFLNDNSLMGYYDFDNNCLSNTGTFTSSVYIKDILNNLGDYKNLRLVLKRKDGSDITVDEYNNVNISYESYVPTISEQVNNLASVSSIIYVSASDSLECDKNKSNLVCDGVNDVDIINQAFDFFRKNKSSGKIIFLNGTYYINKAEDCGDYGQYVFPIKEQGYQKTIEIEGLTPPIRKVNSNPIDLANSAIFKLSEDIYNSIGDKGLTIFGALPILADGSIMYPNIIMNIKNIGIIIPNNKKKIIAIDGFYCSNMKVSDVIGCAQAGDYSTGYSDDKLAIEGCIGIRGLQGYNFGEGYRMDNCFMYFMGIGFSLGGEHLIGCNLGAYGCLYSYGWGLYEKDRVSTHPNTLINCCGEQCVNDMIFGHSKSHQVINIIDYNMEVMPKTHGWSMNPSKELYPGEYRGMVTYVPSDDSYNNSGSLPFWEENSGTNFRTTNLVHKQGGTTDERPVKPNQYQKYWDKTLNKELTYVDGNWKDSTGNNI